MVISSVLTVFPPLVFVSKPTSSQANKCSLPLLVLVTQKEMGALRIPRKHQLFAAIQFLVLLQSNVICYQYKVGNLDSWGIPTSANKHVYTNWSKKTNLKIGDSLLFLYPPSQDSVIQVSEEAFSTCNLKDPVLYMNNGNSLFNITSMGRFYFTSGEPGHCEKSQKLAIAVGNVSDISPSYAPTSLPDSAPSYPTVFGSIPSTSTSSPFKPFSTRIAATVGLAVFTVFRGIM